ncbi:hypothetical protein JW721_02955 [Candidatus Micrarchaeota archaeon]|nr:hypothetical protein [Candidatus Micrarchaeota archaeon]
MHKPGLFLMALSLLISGAFAVTGVQCPEVKEECMNSACISAGGNISASGACMNLPDFDFELYEAHLAQCESLEEFCIENDGLVHNMSFCGPVFIFLPLLLLALCAGGS